MPNESPNLHILEKLIKEKESKENKLIIRLVTKYIDGNRYYKSTSIYPFKKDYSSRYQITQYCFE